MPSVRLRHLLLLLVATLLALPVLAVLGSWFQWDERSSQIVREMARAVLPGYAWTSLWLCLLVGAGVAGVGTAAAAAVTLFDFRGRRTLEWLLLLPLAMPAYVVAYAYTDFLQYAGPAQGWLRETFGWQGRVLPEIRSTGGAAWVFTLALYPYVYLLARSALAERAAHLMEAARLLGAGLSRRIVAVALPLARPAIAAGCALALMETLADYGVASYFGIQTFSAGIYKAWLSMDNRIAAAQLATLLLAVVFVLLGLEQRAQSRLRFATGRGMRAGSDAARPVRPAGWRGALVLLGCLLPVLGGFVLPVAFMLRPLLAQPAALPWERFAEWSLNSLRLGFIGAALAVVIALGLAFSLRRAPDAFTRGVLRLVGLGYAIPGAVIVVGLLLPLGWLQARLPGSGIGWLVTGTACGIVWAYLVRFTAVALQAVQSGYARIPASFDDSARMLGATGVALLARVHWPLLARATAAAALLVFVDVMKELPATLVLRPFDSDTLAVVAWQLARDERLGEAALPSLMLVAVGLLPVWLLAHASRARN